MTLSAKDVPSDLALEVRDALSPERFLAAARAFFGYVKEVTDAVVPEGETLSWSVRVREGSAVIAVEPAKGAAPSLVQRVYARAETAVRHLSDGDIEGAALSDQALKHLQALSELTGRGEQGPGGVCLWVKHVPLDIVPAIAEAIREDWRADYSDHGTVEGKLETIQDRAGSLQLQVRDVMMHQTIRCSFQEDMLAEAFKAFRKRVEVTGLIHFRKNGIPVSIQVDRIERLPDDDELPDIEEVKGVLRAGA